MEKFNLRYLKPSAFIYIIVVLAIGLFLANKYIQNLWGISISVVTLIGVLFGLINSYLWNIKPFRWLYNLSDFSGRYEGTLVYEFRNDKCEIIKDELKHIKEIVQNGSDISVTSWTKKKDGTVSSKSTNIEASIVKDKDGTFKLIYNYLNEGNQFEFAPHYGTEVLTLIENGKGKDLVGQYYTARLPFQTKGEIKLKFKSKKLQGK
jgi:hypothetical protein